MTTGPVEAWLVKTRGMIGFVKGCFHPLPRLLIVPRVINGAKTWSPLEAVEAVRGLPGVRVREEPCLGGRSWASLEPGAAELIAPWGAAKRLRGCSSPACRAAALLLDYLGADLAGVTGGLAYEPEKAGDADIVVYGPRASEEAYKALQDLRRDGVTAPLEPGGHGWSARDKELGAELAAERVLLGRLQGVEYNVRLVHCSAPGPCRPVRLLGPARLRARICGGVPYTTPALYILCGSQVSVMLSYRLRYTEIPIGSVIEAEGMLEEHCGGMKILVPDHGGWVRLLSRRH